jgi:TolA-binding protein
MKKLFNIFVLAVILLYAGGCVYYNTFYHARKAFKEGETKRETVGKAGYKLAATHYKKAIEKTDKVLEKYPYSKWYDDALYINGVSHFWIDNHFTAEKRFRELIANFPESEYITDATLYLAKAKLKLGDIDDAKALFEELFVGSKEKRIRANTALILGEYYTEEKEYNKAETYLMLLVDSLGDSKQKNIAQMYLADGLFDRFQYRQASEAYREILNQDLSSADEYKCKFRIGECQLFLNNIETGLDIFFEMAEDDRYFDSLPAIKLMIARGYEWEDDLEQAEVIYEEIALEAPRKPQGAYSNYILGLIQQYDYEDYKKAKEYYDNAKSVGSISDVYEDALLRSSNIGKLEEYLAMEYNLDSTSTQDEVDRAAETQYLLAELYLTQMDKVDSAFQEFQYILNNFPDAYLAPKAMIAIAIMQRDNYADTSGYDSTLRAMLQDYSKSDFVPEAIGLLGLAGTAADTGYAEIHYKKSEYFMFDNYNIDSARYYMSLVADSFPYSKLNEKAKYVLLWITEEFDSPGDSSLYYGYALYSDSFPNTVYGREARKKRTASSIVAASIDDRSEQATPELEDRQDLKRDTLPGSIGDDKFKTSEEICATGPDGNTIFPVEIPPRRYDKEFRLPPAALSYDFPNQIEFCIQLKIDAFGEIAELSLINPTPCRELNEEVIETVETAHFETYWILPELIDSWFYFNYRVKIPIGRR